MSKVKFDWSLLEKRSELGRQLLLERLVKQNQKQKLLAFALWILLGGLGVHRMYLGQWRQAFTLIGVYFLILTAPILLTMIGSSASVYSSVTMIVLAVGFGVWLYEGARLYAFVNKWNAELRQEIETAMVFV